ncbi:MAG: 50S ribosomal protein L17 [Chloroflexi bacterium]|nr:50S ribosomal protein L17 [Chloroflexota bacterium]MDA1002600.1 50S ribosomal protein L17 [Chloroflexota bacterium]MQC27672.1 50S ribosomal protein L17 [Chloroflexota bacterium]
MRHRKAGRRFDMNTPQRIAMFRNIATAVLAHGGVETTEPRAKEARRFVERMITLGKRGTLHARRQALAYIYDPAVVEQLFDEIAPRYAGRPGGYTRVVKLGARHGDAAPAARLELV